MSSKPAPKRSRAKKAAAVPASIAGLSPEVQAKTPAVRKARYAAKKSKPKTAKPKTAARTPKLNLSVPLIPNDLRGSVQNAQVFILPTRASTRWAQDMFVKIKGVVYYLGAINVRPSSAPYSLSTSSSEAERRVYCKLSGKSQADLERAVRAEHDLKREVAAKRELKSLMMQLDAQGYDVVKKPDQPAAVTRRAGTVSNAKKMPKRTRITAPLLDPKEVGARLRKKADKSPPRPLI